MEKGVKITIENYGHKYTYESEYSDAPIEDLIHAFVCGLECMTWYKSTILDAMKDYVLENDEKYLKYFDETSEDQN